MESITSLIQKNDSRINVEYYDYLWNKIYESETFEEKASLIRAMAAYIYFSIPEEIRKFFYHRHIVYMVINEARICDPKELINLADIIPDEID
jgi:hypothetical protein